MKIDIKTCGLGGYEDIYKLDVPHDNTILDVKKALSKQTGIHEWEFMMCLLINETL